MAKNTNSKNDSDADGDVEEVFTNLDGTPDPLDASVDADELLSGRAKETKAKKPADPGDDDDLNALIDEDETTDTDGDADEEETLQAADEDGGEEEEEEVAQEAAPDPRDQLIKNQQLENIGLQAQRLDDQENFAKAKKAEAENVLSNIKARMKAAKEAGDSDAEVQTQEDWANAKSLHDRAEQALAMVGSERQKLLGKLDEIGYDVKTRSWKETAAKPAQQATTLTPTAKSFLANNKWYGKPEYRAQTQMMASLDVMLANDPKWAKAKGSAEYFGELSKRFNASVPGLVRDLKGKLVATGAQKRGGPGVMPSSGARRQGAKEVKFEQDDIRGMKRFGLNPNDKKARAQWLGEKRALAAAESRGRA